MNTGQIIKLIRTVDGIPQSDVAKQLSITSTYLSLIENGKREPSLPLLKQFSEFYNVPLPLLVFDENHSSLENEIGTQLRNIFTSVLIARTSKKPIT